jgi:hypothetical protein
VPRLRVRQTFRSCTLLSLRWQQGLADHPPPRAALLAPSLPPFGVHAAFLASEPVNLTLLPAIAGCMTCYCRVSAYAVGYSKLVDGSGANTTSAGRLFFCQCGRAGPRRDAAAVSAGSCSGAGSAGGSALPCCGCIRWQHHKPSSNSIQLGHVTAALRPPASQRYTRHEQALRAFQQPAHLCADGDNATLRESMQGAILQVDREVMLTTLTSPTMCVVHGVQKSMPSAATCRCTCMSVP